MKEFSDSGWWCVTKHFGHQTMRDNVALLDDELLQQINARIAAAGREVFAKKDGAPVAALEVKVDSYVLETDVHFPTDLNLLWDAGRKSVDLIEGLLASGHALPGWREFKAWRRQLKACERTASQIVYWRAQVTGCLAGRRSCAAGSDSCGDVKEQPLSTTGQKDVGNDKGLRQPANPPSHSNPRANRSSSSRPR